MNFYGEPHSNLLLIAIYALCFIALNTISFLIALFYKKKFKQSSPRWGFILAVSFAFLFIVCLLGGRTGSPVLQSAARCTIAAGAIASVFSTVSLIFIMQRVRK
jgi:uncharacterized membrane protein YsdA (DUF1294 family)